MRLKILILLLLTSFTGYAQFGFWSSMMAGSGYDGNAQAVIEAIEAKGVTLTTTQKNAIDRRIRDMKGQANTNYTTVNTWSKRTAYYGFVGGTASTHAINWKDPRDLDAAHRLTWSGSPTHSSTGVTGNASSYARTYLVASSLTLNSTHLAIYVKGTTGTSLGSTIGCSDATNLFRYLARNSSNAISNHYNNTVGQGRITAAIGATSDGYHISTRIASNDHAVYYQGASIGTSSTSGGTLPALEIIFMGGNTSGSFSGGGGNGWTFGSLSIGSGITSAEAAADYQSELAFQTALGRN